MKLQGSVIFFQHKHYRHYYLCHYLPLTSGIDTVSRSLLKFKRGAQPDRDNWLNRAITGLDDILPTLPADTIIIRALHHNETHSASTHTPSPSFDHPAAHTPSPPFGHPAAHTTITPTNPLNLTSPITPGPSIDQHAIRRPSSLDLLAQTLSAHSRFPYLPTLLQKRRPTAINQGLTRDQRESELRDVYYLNPAALTPTPSTTPPPPIAPPTLSSILLLDDILTTGTTILSILKTLHSTWPNCTVTIFTLAKVT